MTRELLGIEVEPEALGKGGARACNEGRTSDATRDVNSSRSDFRALEIGIIDAVVATRAVRVHASDEEIEDSCVDCERRVWRAVESGRITLADVRASHPMIVECADSALIDTMRIEHRHESRRARNIIIGIEESGLTDMADPGRLPDEEALGNELILRVNSALSPLNSWHRKLARLRFVRDQSIAEVARATDRSYPAIYMALRRLKKRILRLLEQEGLTEDEFREYLWLTGRSHSGAKYF